MSPKIWEFVALVDDTEGQEIKVNVALKVDRIQSIVKESDDSVMINCDGDVAWKIDGWDYETIVRLWTEELPLRKEFEVNVWRRWSDEQRWIDAWERLGEENKCGKRELLGTWEFSAGCLKPERAINDLLEKLTDDIKSKERNRHPNGEWWLYYENLSEISE